MFNDGQMKLINIVFAVKAFVPSASRMTYEKIRDLHKNLRISYPKHFTNCIVPDDSPPKTNDFLIIDADNKRQIVISNANLKYTENRALNNLNFNKISNTLYLSFLEKNSISFDDIKLIGKIREYQISGVGVYDEFIKKYPLISGERLSKVQLITTCVRDNKNIHIYITGGEAEIEGEPSVLNIKIDINNHDQASGLTEGAFQDIIDFSDAFCKDELYGLLNEKLLGGAKA